MIPGSTGFLGWGVGETETSSLVELVFDPRSDLLVREEELCDVGGFGEGGNSCGLVAGDSSAMLEKSVSMLETVAMRSANLLVCAD